MRWKIEEFDAIVKQLIELKLCQFCRAKIIKNHVVCVMECMELFENNSKFFRKNYLSIETSIVI